jgi:ubiquinone/menaquinone biosynthesis C-methylase UbiE
VSTHPYDNQYTPGNVYGHALGLLARVAAGGGIHLDFGCGFGRMAEQVRDMLGCRYVGLDILEPGLESLQQRGFETLRFDFDDAEASIQRLLDWLPEGEPVVAMTMLDTLEHLQRPTAALETLRRIATRHGCPLVVSVPNVAHRDIRLKLLAGHFDYTAAGLLDETHLQYFTARSVAERMATAGWHEIARDDVLLEHSDQHFPPDHALISAGTPINELLSAIGRQADPHDTVNQFVRMYLAGPQARVQEADEEEPFLTVVTRTRGDRTETLREILLCLSAQDCQDFEVIVVGHRLGLDSQLRVEHVIAELHDGIRGRVRLLVVDRDGRAAPLNAGMEAARGRYVAMLDDDDLVMGHWVSTFRDLHEDNPGKLLRSVAVSQTWDKIAAHHGGLATRARSGYRAQYPESFDLLDHLVENRTPLHSIAFPKSLYRDLGFRFDESLSTAEDWDFIVRAAPVCGVACDPAITCVYRRWEGAETSYTMHSQAEWDANRLYTLRKLDNLPLLLPSGYARKLRELSYDVDRLRSGPPRFHAHSDAGTAPVESEYVEALRWRLHELVHSKSWRVTGWIRYIIAKVRGKPGLPDMQIWRFNARDMEYLIGVIEGSKSWRYTAPLRAVMNIFR